MVFCGSSKWKQTQRIGLCCSSTEWFQQRSDFFRCSDMSKRERKRTCSLNRCKKGLKVVNWGCTGNAGRVGNRVRFSRPWGWSLWMVGKEMGDTALQGCSRNLGWGSGLVHVSWESPILFQTRCHPHNFPSSLLAGRLAEQECREIGKDGFISPLFNEPNIRCWAWSGGWGSLHIKGTRKKHLQGRVACWAEVS